MSENQSNKDIKVKAKSFVEKLSEYFTGKKSSSNNKKVFLEEREKETSSYSAEDNLRLDSFKNTQHDIKGVFLNKMSYESEKDSFVVPSRTLDKYIVPEESIQKEKSQEEKLPYDAYFIQKELADELSKLYLEKQNNNYIKVKADNFVGKVSEQPPKEPEEKKEESFPKDHRIFIGSLAARKLKIKDILPVELEPVKTIQPETSEEIKKTPVPPPVNKVEVKNKKKTDVRDFNIHEDGSFLSFKIGTDTRSEIIQLIKPYSKMRFNHNCKDDSLNFEDISVIFHFDKIGFLTELEFMSGFKYSTEKGLKIGDTIEKAEEIYGKPAYFEGHKYTWSGLEVVSNGFYITNIKTAGPEGYSKQVIPQEKPETPSEPIPESPVAKFNVYTEGMLLGIIVANSTKSIIVNANKKNFVIDFMLEFSRKNFSRGVRGNVLDFDDISIKAIFDDSETLKCLEFGPGFAGHTIKGLKIGDSVDRAKKLYGEPDIEKENSIRWDKLKVYIENNIITSFKISD